MTGTNLLKIVVARWCRGWKAAVPEFGQYGGVADVEAFADARQ